MLCVNIPFCFADKAANSSLKLIPLGDVPLDQLEEYDTKIHTINRRGHLEEFRNLEHAYAAVTNDKQLLGYGCLRPFLDEMYKLGPVLADDANTADVLISSLVKQLPDDKEVMILYYDENSRAIRNMKEPVEPQVHVEFLYTKYPVQVPVEKVFCLANALNSFA